MQGADSSAKTSCPSVGADHLANALAVLLFLCNLRGRLLRVTPIVENANLVNALQRARRRAPFLGFIFPIEIVHRAEPDLHAEQARFVGAGAGQQIVDLGQHFGGLLGDVAVLVVGDLAGEEDEILEHRCAAAAGVLVDAHDVIVHIFRPEVRAYYDLEGMWSVKEPARAAAR